MRDLTQHWGRILKQCLLLPIHLTEVLVEEDEVKVVHCPCS